MNYCANLGKYHQKMGINKELLGQMAEWLDEVFKQKFNDIYTNDMSNGITFIFCFIGEIMGTAYDNESISTPTNINNHLNLDPTMYDSLNANAPGLTKNTFAGISYSAAPIFDNNTSLTLTKQTNTYSKGEHTQHPSLILDNDEHYTDIINDNNEITLNLNGASSVSTGAIINKRTHNNRFSAKHQSITNVDTLNLYTISTERSNSYLNKSNHKLMINDDDNKDDNKSGLSIAINSHHKKSNSMYSSTNMNKNLKWNLNEFLNKIMDMEE